MWNEMPLVTLEREDHLTASRPHIEISEKRATFCKASYEICFSRKFLLLMRGLKPKKILKTIGYKNSVNHRRGMQFIQKQHTRVGLALLKWNFQRSQSGGNPSN